MAGLAFDPTNGDLYASVSPSGNQPDGIFKVDKATGVATLIGTTGLGGGTQDIAFDADGNLYGVKGGGLSGNNDFISIDKTTGAGTVIGKTGFTSVSGLDIEKMKGDMSLIADIQAMDGNVGGVVNLGINAGVANGGRRYIVFSSVTGWEPGTAFPGGMITVPFNWDVFSNLALSLINTPSFANFGGNLSAMGTGQAQFVTGIPIPAP